MTSNSDPNSTKNTPKSAPKNNWENSIGQLGLDASAQMSDTSNSIIKLAVMAVGGQGGGVLTNWIIQLAHKAGFACQMTSVAGVAQRTGATIYYVEMAKNVPGTSPVFALSPAPGDVDILIASELMEAGRAVIRGFVTPDKTTLIASSHRILAVSEKIVPGDGTTDNNAVHRKISDAAWKTVCFDMQAIADTHNSYISASLFGALSASGALPFESELYEEVIGVSGQSQKNSNSLKTFRASREAALKNQQAELHSRVAATPDSLQENLSDINQLPVPPQGPENLLGQWNRLQNKVSDFPESCQVMVLAGLRKTVDYQDTEYGAEYLKQLENMVDLDSAVENHRLTETAAKYIANAMCYDDIVRVADLKTRDSREKRLRREQEVTDENIVHITEYFHPRAEELCATLPSSIANRFTSSPRSMRALDFLVNRGRRIRTDGIVGYTVLWCIAGLKPRRRKLKRHAMEIEHIKDWLYQAKSATAHDYELGIEILKCRRLIKGYSDTHARGQSRFHLILGTLPSLKNRPDAARQIAKLRELALSGNGETMEPLETAIAQLSGNSN